MKSTIKTKENSYGSSDRVSHVNFEQIFNVTATPNYMKVESNSVFWRGPAKWRVTVS